MRIVVLLCCCIGTLLAQQNETAGMLNGRAWVTMSRGDRAMYIIALKDRLTLQIAMLEIKAAESKSEWAQNFTVADYVDEINKVYSERENIHIPVVLAMKFCTYKLNGQTTKDGIDVQLRAMRELSKRWDELWKHAQTPH